MKYIIRRIWEHGVKSPEPTSLPEITLLRWQMVMSPRRSVSPSSLGRSPLNHYILEKGCIWKPTMWVHSMISVAWTRLMLFKRNPPRTKPQKHWIGVVTMVSIASYPPPRKYLRKLPINVVRPCLDFYPKKTPQQYNESFFGRAL